MDTAQRVVLKAETTIDLPVEIVWEFWTNAEHIANWNNVSEEWVTRWAENDATKGGKFFFRMETHDGSQGFDYRGEYMNVIQYKVIESVLDDGRKDKVEFLSDGNSTRLLQVFEANDTDPADMQQRFCQSVIENFKRYAESSWRLGLRN